MSENPYAAPVTVEVKKPEPQKCESLPLATLGQRLAANLIDGVILLFATTIVLVVIQLVVEYFYTIEYTFLVELVISAASLVVYSAVFLMINGPLLAAHGQTFGKFLLKIKIVSNKNQLVPLPKLFLTRYFFMWAFMFVPVVGNIVLFLDPLFIFRANRKCLHDEFANTKVVMKSRPSHMRKLPEKIVEPTIP